MLYEENRFEFDSLQTFHYFRLLYIENMALINGNTLKIRHLLLGSIVYSPFQIRVPWDITRLMDGVETIESYWSLNHSDWYQWQIKHCIRDFVQLRDIAFSF